MHCQRLILGLAWEKWPGKRVHFPYHESDHVLNIAYNAMTGGQCQILTTGRRTVYRLLAWNDSQPIFWRMVEVLNL